MTKLYSTGSTGTIGKHLPVDVYPIELDLSSNKEKFEEINFETQSNLLHLAGVVGSSEILKNIDYARSVNIQGTEFLAHEFLKKSVGIFYYISTSHVYAPSPDIISESSPLAPSNIYAEQKLEAEELLQAIFKSNKERLCIIRIFSVLDWDVAPFTLGGAIRNLAENDPGFTLNNSSDIRDFLAPKAIASALYEVSSQDTSLGTVNLCSGRGTSVGEAARRMLSESGFEIDEAKFEWKQSANSFVVGDNSRLLSEHPTLNLTWQPSTYN